MSRDVCPKCGSRSGYAQYSNGLYCHKCHSGNSTSYSGIYIKNLIPPSLIIEDRILFSIEEFPVTALQWLYKYYVFDSTIKKYRIGYIPEQNRLYIPQYSTDGRIVYYSNRSMDVNTKCKYKTPKGIRQPLNILKGGDSNTLVIVEDMVSAMRIAETGYDVLSLQGTNLPRDYIEILHKHYYNYVLWLDGDEPGRRAELTIKKNLIITQDNNIRRNKWLVHIDIPEIIIMSICTEGDPKSYTNGEIKKRIENVKQPCKIIFSNASFCE